mmetsp:Transcript_10374/g.26321  ORF Transcript_10374/g.26321 Transcript_10374/m.26321 type:complete len:207 (-) Transcript_10374:81-701(-)
MRGVLVAQAALHDAYRTARRRLLEECPESLLRRQRDPFPKRVNMSRRSKTGNLFDGSAIHSRCFWPCDCFLFHHEHIDRFVHEHLGLAALDGIDFDAPRTFDILLERGMQERPAQPRAHVHHDTLFVHAQGAHDFGNAGRCNGPVDAFHAFATADAIFHHAHTLVQVLHHPVITDAATMGTIVRGSHCANCSSLPRDALMLHGMTN